MSKRFLTPVGMLSESTDPVSAITGDMYFNSASNIVRIFYNSDWHSIHNVTASYGLYADHIDFSTTPITTGSVARLVWNDADGTLDLGLKGGAVTLQLGQEEVLRVVNNTGLNLLENEYRAVKLSSAQGQRPSIVLAKGTNDANSANTLGLVTENIDNNQEGFITLSGMVRKINTTGSLQGETWNDGDILYLSAASAGYLTNIKPTAPSHTVIVGFVIYSHIVNGKIFVKVDNGYEIDELHNVLISSPTASQSLLYDSSASVWKNITLSSVASATVSSSSTFAQTASTVLVSPSALYVDHIDFSVTPVTTVSSARLVWNSTYGTAELGMVDGAQIITTLIGQNSYVKVINKDSVPMVKGDVVYLFGSVGQKSSVKLAAAAPDGIENSPIGLCAEPIAVNGIGFIMTQGNLSGLNTVGYTEGDAIWLSASAGKFTDVRPPAPLHGNIIGNIVSANANGTVFIRLIGGSNIDFLDDVVLTASTLINNNILIYNSSASYWENSTIQSKITTASVGYANSSASSTTSTSAVISGSAIISSSAVTVTTRVASATISASAITSSSAVTSSSANVSASTDWNGVSNKPSSTGTASLVFSNGPTFTGSVSLPYESVYFRTAAGQEGGQFIMERPPTTSLSANVTLDIFNNSLRIFENGGNSRGYTLDITQGATSAGSTFWTSANMFTGIINTTVPTSSGVYGFSVSPGTVLNGCVVTNRSAGTAARIHNTQVNVALDGTTASNGFVRGYVVAPPNAPVAPGGVVFGYYMAW